MTAAQQILDRVIITPPLSKAFVPGARVAAGAELTRSPFPSYRRRRLHGGGVAAKARNPGQTDPQSGWSGRGTLAGRNVSGRSGDPRIGVDEGDPGAQPVAAPGAADARRPYAFDRRRRDAPARITSVDVDQMPESCVAREARAALPAARHRARRRAAAAAQGSAAGAGVVPAARFPASGGAREIDQFMALFDRVGAARRSLYREHEAGAARRAGLAGFSVPPGEAQSRAGHSSAGPV